MFNRWPPILVPSLTASSPPVARSAAAALTLIESILMASFRRASCSAIYLMNTSGPLMINERLIFRLPAANIFSLGGNVRFGFMVGTDSLLVSPDRCLERRRQTSITLMESSRYPFYPDIKGSGRIVFRFRNNFFFQRVHLEIRRTRVAGCGNDVDFHLVAASGQITEGENQVAQRAKVSSGR